MGMDVILFIDEECPPCADAQEAMKEYIEKNEVQVMPIQEGLKQFDLGEPEGVPFLAVISPSTKKAINKIYFKGTPTQEIKAESPSQPESGS